jgi:prepilin-type N-terminal cleavage/methylation domain-containing protein
MSTSRRSSTRAFTLVEMLVVLGIIGILAALLLPAIMAAVRNARNAAIALEIKNIGNALETYKQQRGEYPPCFGDYDNMGNLVYSNTTTRNSSAVERHLQRCYPKFTNTMTKNAFYTKAAGVDQGEALVMWLSMMSTNPANPFDATSGISRHGYYEFDARRLIDVDGDGISTYQSAYTRDTPYIYVENRNYQQLLQQNCYARATQPDGSTAQTLPYSTAKATQFQILSAGQDGEWGDLTTPTGMPMKYPPKVFPNGTNYFAGDRDNVTSFSEGKTLGDARPE